MSMQSTLEMQPKLKASALNSLRAAISGVLFTPTDPGYDAARALWNGYIDRRPAVIVRCRTTQDAALAIRFAREHGLPLSIRSGGHNGAGLALADNGLVVDLSQMKQTIVDPQQRTVWAEPGLTLREFVAALEPFGLITTTGTCGGNGLGGATLGGGIGWLMGRYGMIIDNVLAFELVTADGQVRRASATEHPDLFWALRGGGGNFGVVTRIQYQLYPLGQVLAGMVVHALDKAGDPLRFFHDYSLNAPDVIGTMASMATPPQVGPAFVMMACYAGDDLGEGERMLAGFRQVGSPLADLIRPMAYSELLAMLDPVAPDGRNYYDTAYTLRQPVDAAFDALLECAAARTSPFSSIVLHPFQGAATRVAPDATAFALREPHFAIVHAAGWEAGSGEEHIAWADTSLARMAPYASHGLYVNFMGHEEEDEVRAAYRANYARLAAIKAKYDPENVLQLNQNIKPAAM
ncbi:MAG: FAD-binding oxidoreductase [Caldilineaceae bacterium]|nr:FAD-binding oxidoreductase [Caldilineaceae bacterium]